MAKLRRTVDPEAATKHVLRQQLRDFRKRFGRDPLPAEPVFSDSDQDVPMEMSEESCARACSSCCLSSHPSSPTPTRSQDRCYSWSSRLSTIQAGGPGASVADYFNATGTGAPPHTIFQPTEMMSMLTSAVPSSGGGPARIVDAGNWSNGASLWKNTWL